MNADALKNLLHRIIASTPPAEWLMESPDKHIAIYQMGSVHFVVAFDKDYNIKSITHQGNTIEWEK